MSTPLATSATPSSSLRLAWGVLILCTGQFILASFYHLYTGWNRTSIPMSNKGLLSVIVFETIMVALLVPVLKRRGWTWECATVPFAARDLIQGLGLYLACYVAYYGCTYLIFLIAWLFNHHWAASLVKTHHFVGHVTWPFVVLGVLINPVFEELVYLGFGYQALLPYGRRVAAGIVIALRVVIHAYQGVWALTSILPMGIILTYFFMQKRRLWPVIIAHGISDALGLSILMI